MLYLGTFIKAILLRRNILWQHHWLKLEQNYKRKTHAVQAEEDPQATTPFIRIGTYQKVPALELDSYQTATQATTSFGQNV
jgi:hypothetical protein